MTNGQWIGMQEAADRYQVASEHISQWCEKGEVTYSKIDGYLMIDEESLWACLERNLCLSLSEKELQQRMEKVVKENEEKAFVLQSLVEITPLLHMVINELAQTIPNTVRRRLFLYMTLKGSLKDYSQEYGVRLHDIKREYERLMREINARVGFLMTGKQELADAQAKLRLYEEKFGKDILKDFEEERKTVLSEKDEEAMKLLNTSVYDLGFPNALSIALYREGMHTLRDIMRLVYKFGSSKIISLRAVGNYYSQVIIDKLKEMKVLDENDNSYLYPYLKEDELDGTPRGICTWLEARRGK